MNGLVQWFERPQLHEPVLAMMLTGWIDTSGAAAGAMSALDAASSARTIARFDRDTFIDYRSRRPTMEVREGVNTRLVWPDIELKAGVDRDGRDLLLLCGHEPDSAWERFSATVLELGEELGVVQVVGLGAFPNASPHTRPVRITATSPDRQLLAGLPYTRDSVDVPAGITAVLEQAFHGRRIAALTLWAQVPHYVSAMSYPAASVALLEEFTRLTRLSLDTSHLRGEAIVQRQRLDDLVAANEEHTAMVHQLEQVYDARTTSPSSVHPSIADATPLDLDRIPSAEELAEELEQYLRDQGPA